MKKKITEFRFEIIVVIAFITMSISTCSRYTINFDEFYTLLWCRNSWQEFFHEVLHDTAPFLYYYMIRPFAILTGQNIFMARLFSVAALLILLLIGVTFVKKNFGRKAMYFYLAIMYLNPFMLQKATEIRMYVWASAFTLLSGMFCYQVLAAPTRKGWIGFTLFSLLASYTHYYAVLAMVFLYLGLLLYYFLHHNGKEMKNWLICSIVTVAAYLPFLVIAIFQIIESESQGEEWIHLPSSRLAPLKELFYSGVQGSEILYLAVMAGFTLAAFAAYIYKKKVEYYWAAICSSAIWGIVAFCIIFCELAGPIMLSRYLIMPVCLLFLGISPMVRLVNKYFILALCLAFAFISGIQYKDILKTAANDHTVETIRFAEENIGEGDKIVLLSGDDYLYNCTYYYIPQAKIYYAGTFGADLFNGEDGYDEAWFFDNGDRMDRGELEKSGLVAESFGQYQFGYIDMEIYKVKRQNK